MECAPGTRLGSRRGGRRELGALGGAVARDSPKSYHVMRYTRLPVLLPARRAARLPGRPGQLLGERPRRRGARPRRRGGRAAICRPKFADPVSRHARLLQSVAPRRRPARRWGRPARSPRRAALRASLRGGARVRDLGPYRHLRSPGREARFGRL